MAESDQSVPDQALGTEARGLVRRALKATLATIGAQADPPSHGWPAAALVTMAAACDGSPILLLSTLAHHTRNILADPRAALLVDGTEGFANPQAGPRVTLMGRIAATSDPAAPRRFLARHPAARHYAGFGDFAFYTMTVERLHSVGGFARARWLDAAHAILPAELCADVAQHEPDILVHMNNDHAESLALYGTRLLRARARKFELIGVDPDGFDLRCGRTLRRFDFARRVSTLGDVRAEFVALAQQARDVRR